MPHKKCLKMQAVDRLKPLVSYGLSKHEVKSQAAAEWTVLSREAKASGRSFMSKNEYINDALRPHIFSNETYKTYAKQNNKFFEYMEKNHPKCNTLEKCRPYCNEYLADRMSKGDSASSLKTARAAMGKLYQEPAKNFLDLPDRRRADFKRSRGEKVRDKHFSKKNNAEKIEVCRSCGFRRGEIKGAEKIQAFYAPNKDRYYVKIINGKGGKTRLSEIVSKDPHAVTQYINNNFNHISNAADVHDYRADYCRRIYEKYARPIYQVPRNERYYCRGDRKGEVFDKRAMKIASQNLGHERLNVIAQSYLR